MQLFLFLAVLILCPVAFCQEQERFLAKLPQQDCCFFHKDFLKVCTTPPTQDFFNIRQTPNQRKNWEAKTRHGLTPYGFQSPETNLLLSAQAVQANLKVLRQNNYRPRGEGNFWLRIRHVLVEGSRSLGEYNLASWYYQRNTGAPNLFNPRTRYDYYRNRDPLSWTGRQFLNAWKRALILEFKPSVLRWIKKN